MSATLRGNLLRRLLAENPFQPATSWWRSIELAVVIEYGLPRGTGLDLGCGDGKLMRILLDAAGAAPDLVGVDIDPLETRDAAASGVYRRVHTVPGAAIPELDASFDFAFSNSVLEHIPELDPVMAEVARVLRPGAPFIFTVPSDGFHDCLAGPLLPWVEREHYLGIIDRRCLHLRYWGEAEWRACLARNGLELVHALPYLSRAETQRWETLSRFTSGVLYGLARGRLRPIEIQRALRVRRPGLRLPGWVASLLAAAAGAGTGGGTAGGHGCLLVEARKPA